LTLEAGTVEVQQFALTGPATELQLAGSANIIDQQINEVTISGDVDLGLLNGFSDAIAAQGDLQIQAAVRGPFAQPEFEGFLEMDNGQIAMSDPAVDLSQLSLRADLEGNGVAIQQLNGVLNGGTLEGMGRIDLIDGQPVPDLALNVSDVFLELPE